jgi:quercetin dioxygenase-like cupin family protein
MMQQPGRIRMDPEVFSRAFGDELHRRADRLTSLQRQRCEGQSMRIHNLYADESGASHFRDIEVEWVHSHPGGKLSKRLAATGVIFRQTSGDYDLGWHTAPRRQYIVDLDAAVEITASDGETRVIGAGEVLLVEDTAGKGHLSKAVSSQIRHSIFIRVD